MSDSAKRFYDPRTEGGISLGNDKPTAPLIHECGLMRLDASWCYEQVCSPFWRAYLNFDSGAAVHCRGVDVPLLPGTLVLLPAETVYHCRPATGVRHLWIHFSPSADASPGPIIRKLSPAQLQAWQELASLIEAATPASLLAATCAGLLLPQLAGAAANTVVHLSPRMESLTGWLDLRLARPPPVAAMAAWTGMSPRSFARWFQNETGETPAAWLTRRRVREACRLLRFSDASIEAIAETTGFANRHHFTRIFTRETGTAPAAFRKQGTSPRATAGQPKSATKST